MIIRLLTEMDSLDSLVPEEPDAGLGGNFRIDYGRNNSSGVLSLYAFFFGNRKPFDDMVNLYLKPIYVITEKGDRIKMFARGKISPIISNLSIELIMKQVVTDLMSYFKKVGHPGFEPLMKYSWDMTCGIKRNDFAEVLRDCDFNVPVGLFKSEQEGILTCFRNDSLIQILPSDQLLAITDDAGEISAYLTKCNLAHSNEPYLYKPPIINQLEYTKACLCRINLLRDAWNEYVRTL